MLPEREVKMPNARWLNAYRVKEPVSLANQPRMLREPGLWLKLKIILKHQRFLITYCAAYGNLAQGIKCLYSSTKDLSGATM